MSSLKNSIEKGRHEGRKEGREEGIKIGEEMGIQIGQERGIKIGEEMGKIKGKAEGEQQARIAVAKNLLKAGISIDVISQTTDLPQAEVSQLKEEIA
ncbi:hypothetical protein [Candidatus Wolbachia massiliensis]|uniref:hypothetical protein n=1 Tax=Candidatus Wolbachia massiliensis TaxID=1845000 RepID=UPI0037BE4394